VSNGKAALIKGGICGKEYDYDWDQHTPYRYKCSFHSEAIINKGSASKARELLELAQMTAY